MSIAAIATDPISILLIIGMVLSAGTAIALATARSDRPSTAPQPKPTPLELSSPATILAKANAAARQQSRAATSGYRLESVRPVAAAGHERQVADDQQADRAERRAKAAALAVHIAENDPQRMAEVIRKWIRSSDTGTEPNRP